MLVLGPENAFDMPVLNNFSLQISPDYLIKQLRLGERKDAHSTAHDLIQTTQALIAPKIVYRVSYIEERAGDSIMIEGQTFTSSVLKKNLENVERVFPYIITVGSALEKKTSIMDDLLKQYYLEITADIALRLGKTHLEKHLKKLYGLEKISSMSPGSLMNWPITEQKPLFALFGDTEKLVGVRLTDSMLMLPRKSISGIVFPTEVTFTSCQLCPRERCEERKGAYDPSLRKTYGLADE
jgi:hypothetical protein